MIFNKPVKITAYAADLSVYTNNQPKTGKSIETPSWLSRLKASIKTWNPAIGLHDKAGTVAVCPGIREFVSSPIALNMWAEIDIRINPDGSWSSTSQSRPDLNTEISEHHEDQWQGMYPGKRVALKLSNPWKFVSDSDVKYVFTESHYSTSYFRERGIWISPGVTNFKYQHSTNIHLNCPVKDEPYVISLKYGSPLISLFPMTERPVEIECIKISPPEWGELGDHMPRTVVGKYFKQKGIKS
jgi:hypothetical protein